jgi:regulator of sigma E protease
MAEPLKLTVRRPATSPGDEEPAATQAIEVVVPARPMRMMGLAMQVGPIVAVRAGSPADIAGLRPGDVVLTIGGQEIGDPMTLAQRLLPLIGEELQMTVRRDGGKPVSLHVTPEPPTANSPCNPLTPLLLDSLGVAMRVESLVQSVDPHGPAFEAGLCAGDEITEVRFYPTDAEQRRGMHAMFGRLPEEPIELSDESPNWPSIHACIQETRVLPQLDVTYRRGDAVGTALLTPIESEVWSQVDRGLRFEPLQQRRVADSWAEACTAGFGETRAMVGQIVAVLRRLVSGELGTESIGGGPIVVIRAGTSEAAEGPPRLLLFIAFVSINFAFLCCLPIPPLDGGHLLFLVVEGVRGKPVSNKAQLTIIAITVGGFLVLACALLFPCLSQFLRVIGLFRGLGGAGKESG